MKRIAIILATTLALEVAAAAPESPCTRLFVERSEHPGEFLTTVSAVETLDLDLTVAIPWKLAVGWKDEHAMEVQVITPKGNVYQSIDFRFTVEKRGRRTSLFVPGQKDAVEAELLPLDGKGQSKHLGVKVRLPVGGSTIMQNSMYGTWSVAVIVDGMVVSCVGSESAFELGE